MIRRITFNHSTFVILKIPQSRINKDVEDCDDDYDDDDDKNNKTSSTFLLFFFLYSSLDTYVLYIFSSIYSSQSILYAIMFHFLLCFKYLFVIIIKNCFL